jgi:hypothetical protein
MKRKTDEVRIFPLAAPLGSVGRDRSRSPFGGLGVDRIRNPEPDAEEGDGEADCRSDLYRTADVGEVWIEGL